MTAKLGLLLIVLNSPLQIPRAEPDAFALSLHRSMELDDQDRAIRRQRDLIHARRAQFENTRRLAEKGLVSRDDLARELTDLRLQEAREAEMVAYRTLKAFELDVLEGIGSGDESRGYRLLLNLLKKQEAMASIETEYRGYRLRQEQALLERGATSTAIRDLAWLDYEQAKGSVAISQARQAQVIMEMAARVGADPVDPEDYQRKKADYLRARIRYSEIRIAGLVKRLELARKGRDSGVVPESESEAIQRMLNEALEELDQEKALLKDLTAPLPPRLRRFA